MNIFERNYYVEICDIDTKNELTNYGMLRMMQEIAGAHSDSLGISINHTHTKPYTWLLLNWKLKVFSRPKWNSKLLVKTWASLSDKLYSYRDFEIFTENNTLVAQGSSKWVLIKLQFNSQLPLTSFTLEKTSPEVLSLYKPSNTYIFGNETIKKLKEPNEHNFITNYTVQRSDLDINGHANNLSYLHIANNILPDEVYKTDFRNLEIMYKKECKLGDELACIYASQNNIHTITIKSKDLNTLHCIIEMKT